uniref:Uncharacterized protein n=1 Tax=Glossina morsitans morsitans TaxID=37546 RepID=A0A1B0FG88_GLOMM
MSAKLLKQAIEIVEEDLQPIPNKKAKQSKEATDKRTRFKVQSKKQAILQKQTVSGKHGEKKNIFTIREELETNNKKTEENIKRLLALSMNSVKVKDAEKIVRRAHKGRYVEKTLPKIEQESIFTEEDFRAFEEEYFNS